MEGVKRIELNKITIKKKSDGYVLEYFFLEIGRTMCLGTDDTNSEYIFKNIKECTDRLNFIKNNQLFYKII